MNTKLPRILATFVALTALMLPAYSQVASEVKQEAKRVELKVTEDFDKALAEAKKEKKLLMLYFLGSDWCPPCKMLHRYVIDTEDFAKYAEKNLKVVFSDWARGSGPKSKDFKARHERLAEEYQLEAFPTIIFINPENGKRFKLMGYVVKSPKELIERVEAFRTQK